MTAGELATTLGERPLLALTVVAIVLAVAAQMIAPQRPGLSRGMRNGAYLGMLVAGLLTVVEFAGNNRSSDAAFWLDHTRAATIEGQETVVSMRADGHFWVKAQLNGEPVDFLIDTGATYTTVPESVAQTTGLAASENGDGRLLDTANGTVVARMATARSLRFGSVDAIGLPLAVLPDTQNDTAVIGMNLLSKMKSWRVENNRLILTP